MKDNLYYCEACHTRVPLETMRPHKNLYYCEKCYEVVVTQGPWEPGRVVRDAADRPERGREEGA